MVLIKFRMRITLAILVFCILHANAKTKKKTPVDSQEDEIMITSEKSQKPESKATDKAAAPPQSAIIAIEIVDPNDNSTKDVKGRKRTIESALGYGHHPNNDGYENFFSVKPKPPRYQVYKYSQSDIPPYKGPVKEIPLETFDGSYGHAAPPSAHDQHHQQHYEQPDYVDSQYPEHRGVGAHQDGAFQIQKSVQYDLGSTPPVYVPHNKPQATAQLQQYYQSGATLFSTLDQSGHLSSLSAQVPHHRGAMVPVIIFRVYTDQLGQTGGLHPNIPHGHPYANLNNVDLQGLLAGYVRKHPQQYYQRHQPQAHGSQQFYQAPAQPQAHAYLPQSHNHNHHHEHPAASHSHSHEIGLPTNENYPDDAHTKVIFHKTKPKNRNKANRQHTQKFKITIPENTYSKVEVQEHTYGAPETAQYLQQQVQQHYAHAQAQTHNTQAQPHESHQYAQQQYYYEPQQEQQQQHQQQQEQQYHQQEYQQSVQSVVQYQHDPHTQQVAEAEQPVQYDAKQYIQVAYADQGQTTQQHQQEQQQHEVQDQNQQQQYQSGEYYQQGQQYIQYEEVPANQAVQHHHQQQQGQQQNEEPHSGQNQHQHQVYGQPSDTGDVQYLQRNPEHPNENPDYSLVKNSNDAGRDLHPKVYNYHAHTQHTRGTTQKKKRERKTRVPLVLAPGVMDALRASNTNKKH